MMYEEGSRERRIEQDRKKRAKKKLRKKAKIKMGRKEWRFWKKERKKKNLADGVLFWQETEEEKEVESDSNSNRDK